jgi:hypothetical protein
MVKMANDSVEKIDDLGQQELSELAMDMLHRIVVHYGLWFGEVRHQMGMETALDALDSAFKRSRAIQVKRLAKVFGFEEKDGVPVALLAMKKEQLLEFIDSVAVNWLANDGVWFQAVEFASGMTDAKRCNDSCWAHFSPFEARDICRFLDLPRHPGLPGLKKALQFRLYARINTQSFIEESPTSLVFQMNKCRVQAARKRKNLDDYPCKSGGVVEYTYFARTVDPRIRTECIGCPPDEHPEDWFCSWRFTLDDTGEHRP